MGPQWLAYSLQIGESGTFDDAPGGQNPLVTDIAIYHGLPYANKSSYYEHLSERYSVRSSAAGALLNQGEYHIDCRCSYRNQLSQFLDGRNERINFHRPAKFQVL